MNKQASKIDISKTPLPIVTEDEILIGLDANDLRVVLEKWAASRFAVNRKDVSIFMPQDIPEIKVHMNLKNEQPIPLSPSASV